MGLLGAIIKAGVEEFIEEKCSDTVQVITKNIKIITDSSKSSNK